MTGDPGFTTNKGTAALIALALLMIGAGGSYLLMRSSARNRTPATPSLPAETAGTPGSGGQPPAAIPGTVNAALADVVVPLGADAVERAGIVVAPVSSADSAADIRLPGVVEPNAYRQVVVTPLVGGRVLRVSAELGDRVRRGQPLAQIYSPELADAQTRYASAKALLDAHDRELERTEKLVAIGAASRQELEKVHAEHAAQAAAVQSARSQLELLGVPASTIASLGSGKEVNATTSVPAPIDGVITERAANVGLNVDPATAVFTVVDLSTVWIVADVYEKDFSRVRVGSEATITTAAYPSLSLRGRVSYIHPQVNPETRTARIRAEVPNPRGELRLGMYADVSVTAAPGPSAPVVPRRAIQHIGDRTVVYLADPSEPGTFTEREVRLGEASGEQVTVASGVRPGDVIVTEGSFFIRAERERLGLRSATTSVEAAPGASASGDGAAATLQTAKVVVNDRGFEPARVTLRADVPARITFLRTSDRTCATEVVFRSLDIKRGLPLNEPVQIEFTPAREGELAFACGMDMLKGIVVVR